FFSSRRRHTRFSRDWSSDVCSSDLGVPNSFLIKKLFGTPHERAVRKMRPKVAKINDLEKEISKLSDAKLKAKTAEFKEMLDNGRSEERRVGTECRSRGAT